MKKLAILILLMCSFIYGKAQIGVRLNNITQVVFPSEIDYYRGGFIPSDFVIDQRTNILFITPSHVTEATNISVVLKNGMIYSLLITYQNKMTDFLISLPESRADYKPLAFEPQNVITSQDSVIREESSLRKILQSKGNIYTQNTSHYKKLFLILKGVYVDDNTIYVRLHIDNRSNIRFDFEYLAFYISSKKKKDRISGEQLQLVPKEEHGYSKIIPSGVSNEMVFAFDKFTIGEDRLLYIDLVEQNGERNLKLNIGDELILKAVKL